MATVMDAFDVCGPLPQGTTLLEASAGTGKTWTIGALVTRFVAEGEALLEEMLVVTFGRAASQELRERVRTQLVEAERALGDDPALAGEVVDSDLIRLLLDCDAEERRTRHRRVLEALAGFDAATIATTHQFCSMVLGSLGVAGDSDSQARLVEDLDDLMGEVVDDLYLRAFAFGDEDPVFDHQEAMAIARAAIGDPQAVLEPAAEDRATPVGRRVAFAQAVRDEMERRKRRLGILSYDDLLEQLADALVDDDAPARARMRQRWQIVLVDEFQDTDPVQWQVLDRAFSGHATMVLIGDPKQAIYAFRGGDVTTYLQAAETATTRQTLAVNWRSDAALLAQTQQLLGGAELGDERIVVHDVEAHHQERRLVGAPKDAALRVRVVRREQFGRRGGSTLTVGQVRPHISQDLALDVRALLAAGATFDGRPIAPADVAVICYRHADLAAARSALAEVGVPAVIAGGGSVFATPAAVEWLSLLEALEQPHRSARVRAAALTCFFGHTAAELDGRGDDLTDEVADRLRSWLEVFGSRGIAAVLEAATAGGLPGRVLAEVGGERRLTDLRHIGEALHEVAQRDHLGVVVAVELAARAGDRGACRARRRAHPTARLRRGGRAAGHHPRQQGAGVPRGLPPGRRRPVRAQALTTALPRRRGPAMPQRRRRWRRLERPLPALGRRGGRRVAAAAVRRDHPRPVPGRVLVGADQERRRLAAAPAADARTGATASCRRPRRCRPTTRWSTCSPAGATAAARRPSPRSRPPAGDDPPRRPGAAARRPGLRPRGRR